MRARAAGQKVHIALADKLSGCIVWVYFDESTLELGPFLYFGGMPGDALPDLSSFKVAKHTKATSYGEKLERPNIREVKKGAFTELESVEELWNTLFGNT